MKALVIVESPAKARTLAAMLGPDYLVRASMGHVRDLPADTLGVDIADNFKPAYTVLRQKAKMVRTLRDAIQQAGELYLATDPDREGEAIAWHLLQLLKPKNKIVRRVTFHQITPAAIREAFTQPQHNLDMNLVNAQQARRILDRLVGYQVSPLLWHTTHGKSAGRVQSVALRLVVDREREIQQFQPREYWSIHADLATPHDHSQHFLARLIQIGPYRVGLDERIQLRTQSDADQVKAALAAATYRVNTIKLTKELRKPWPPFTTSTLQQAASARLRLAPGDTMKIAQELYEGVDIGAGATAGLITYMRTDAVNVAPEAQAAAREVISRMIGSQYLPATAPVYKTKVRNAQEAHEAIRPTDVFRLPADIRQHLSERQYKLYDLIWRRFVASQMSPAVYDVTTVDVNAVLRADQYAAPSCLPQEAGSEPPVFLFRAVGRMLRSDGFLRVWEEDGASEEQDEFVSQLPDLAKDQSLDLLELIARQHFTQPPQRYTEASLIKALEVRGIGRPSTYATIMGTLHKREYVITDKRMLHPTALGEHTCDSLVAAFPDLMDYDFTAQVEERLDAVSRGDEDWVKTLADFYTPFSAELNQAEDKMRGIPKPETAAASADSHDRANAPDTSGTVRHGRGKSTARKPGSHTGKAGKRSGNKAAMTNVHCPLCGAPMVQRTGPRGPFLGCSRYPQCKGTRAIKPVSASAGGHDNPV